MTNAAVLRPGVRLGKYELIKQLAIGGMAEIYLARVRGIERFEKLVVLKRILPQHATNPEFVAMFLDEARLVATLQHANIAQVYDIGQADGSLFFTMEFVNGEDVRTLLRRVVHDRRRLPLEHGLTIAIGAAAGLHAAHDKIGLDGRPLDIVHRDVSPANIIVSFDGCVKVIDFGVAKATRRQTETRAGTLKGKISYMAPEQCRGEPVDRRADVFALGIVLYELTTSRKLFRGNEFAILKQITERDVEPPSRLRATYPAELERIVMRALQRDPARRYGSAQQLQIDLERFARTHQLVTSSVRLGEYMRDLFAPKLSEWMELQRRLRAQTTHRTPLECVPIEIVECHTDTVVQPTPQPTASEAVPESLVTAPSSLPVPVAPPLVKQAALDDPRRSADLRWRRLGLSVIAAAASAVMVLGGVMVLNMGEYTAASALAGSRSGFGQAEARGAAHAQWDADVEPEAEPEPRTATAAGRTARAPATPVRATRVRARRSPVNRTWRRAGAGNRFRANARKQRSKQILERLGFVTTLDGMSSPGGTRRTRPTRSRMPPARARRLARPRTPPDRSRVQRSRAKPSNARSPKRNWNRDSALPP